MKSMIAATIGLILAAVTALVIYLGGFKPVALSEGEAGPFKLVSKSHVGAYYKIVPVIETVETWARANGESCRQSFGEFLDNPDLVEEDRLRSNAGCIVTKEWSTGLPEGFEYRELPARRYVIAEFEGAPSIGPMKVYPKAHEYIAEKKLTVDGPVIELYEILSEKAVRTRYLFPVR